MILMMMMCEYYSHTLVSLILYGSVLYTTIVYNIHNIFNMDIHTQIHHTV